MAFSADFVKEFCDKVEDVYTMLYDSDCEEDVPGYLEAMDLGDRFLADDANKDLIAALVICRGGDCFTSDREAAALGYIARSYALV